MFKIKKIFLLSMLAVILLSVSCKNDNDTVGDGGEAPQTPDVTATDTFSIGEVNDNVYVNPYFEMSINIPEEMYILPALELEERTQQDIELGADIIMSSNTELSDDEDLEQIKEEAQRIYGEYINNCLMVYGRQPTPTDSADTQFVVQAFSTVVELPSIAKTSAEYLDTYKEGLLTEWGDGDFKDIYQETIGSKQFDVQEAVFSIADLQITYKVYVTKIKDHLLVLTFVNNSAASQSELDALNSILNSVKI